MERIIEQKADGVNVSTTLPADTDRLLRQQECEKIIARIRQIDKSGNNTTIIVIGAWWQGELRWARNRVSLASDRRDNTVTVIRNVNGAAGVGTTNQTDDESLIGVMRMAERSAELGNRRAFPSFDVIPPELATPATKIWSDATFNATAEARGELARTLTESSDTNNLLSSGYLEMRGAEQASFFPRSGMPDKIVYRQLTQSQCSMTVRHPKGVGSGWAGLSSYDWAAINAPLLAQRALDKCIASTNPVAIEPGRYTTILEPQATLFLVEPMIVGGTSVNARATAEQGQGPFALEYDQSLQLWRTKLGLAIIDERITIGHNPIDPMLGVESEPGLAPVTWIERGVLTGLSYQREGYSLPELNDNLPMSPRMAFHMSGGTTTKEEMIATTKRGLLVTRFSNGGGADPNTLVMSGFTRDGLWLIENGKISKAVKNFRFLESPLFALNQVDQLGSPEPVFRPVKNPYTFSLMPAMVPTIKVNDFSFTHLIDAV